jgi:hypothetical protein
MHGTSIKIKIKKTDQYSLQAAYGSRMLLANPFVGNPYNRPLIKG